MLRTSASKNTESKKTCGPKPLAAEGTGTPQAHSEHLALKTDCPCGGGCPRCRGVHAKLKVGEPGDVFEQQADKAAQDCVEHVTQPALPSPVMASPSPQGQPLPEPERKFYERRLGHDFSPVRLHTGPEAGQAADQLGARAFTLGNDIVFGPNEYAPQSEPGKKLLAHELAHVAQQRTNEIRRAPKDGEQGEIVPGESRTIGQAGEPLDMRLVREELIKQGYTIYFKDEFQQLPVLERAFPDERARPEMVAEKPGKGFLVVDITKDPSSPTKIKPGDNRPLPVEEGRKQKAEFQGNQYRPRDTADEMVPPQSEEYFYQPYESTFKLHMEKTMENGRQLARALSGEYSGYYVKVMEYYWGLGKYSREILIKAQKEPVPGKPPARPLEVPAKEKTESARPERKAEKSSAGEVAGPSPAEVTRLLAQTFHRPVLDPERGVCVSPTSEQFAHEWWFAGGEGPVPAGFYDTQFQVTHLPAEHSLWDAVHERLHWIGRVQETEKAVGQFLEEGLTEFFTLKALGPDPNGRVYNDNVKFVEELSKIVGVEALMRGYFDGDWEILRLKIQEYVGSTGQTDELLRLLRSIGPNGENLLKLGQVMEILKPTAEAPLAEAPQSIPETPFQLQRSGESLPFNRNPEERIELNNKTNEVSRTVPDIPVATGPVEPAVPMGGMRSKPAAIGVHGAGLIVVANEILTPYANIHRNQTQEIQRVADVIKLWKKLLGRSPSVGFWNWQQNQESTEKQTSTGVGVFSDYVVQYIKDIDLSNLRKNLLDQYQDYAEYQVFLQEARGLSAIVQDKEKRSYVVVNHVAEAKAYEITAELAFVENELLKNKQAEINKRFSADPHPLFRLKPNTPLFVYPYHEGRIENAADTLGPNPLFVIQSVQEGLLNSMKNFHLSLGSYAKIWPANADAYRALAHAKFKVSGSTQKYANKLRNQGLTLEPEFPGLADMSFVSQPQSPDGQFGRVEYHEDREMASHMAGTGELRYAWADQENLEPL